MVWSISTTTQQATSFWQVLWLLPSPFPTPQFDSWLRHKINFCCQKALGLSLFWRLNKFPVIMTQWLTPCSSHRWQEDLTYSQKDTDNLTHTLTSSTKSSQATHFICMYVRMYMYDCLLTYLTVFKLLQLPNLLSIVCSAWNGLSTKKSLVLIFVWPRGQMQAYFDDIYVTTLVSGTNPALISSSRSLERQVLTKSIANVVSGFLARAASRCLLRKQRTCSYLPSIHQNNSDKET